MSVTFLTIVLDTVPETIDIKDLNKRLPFLEKTIKEEDIKIIETYVTEKVGRNANTSNA